MMAAWTNLSLAVLLGCVWFAGLTCASNKDKRKWVTGFQKIEGSCLPVGGLANPGELPFPFKTMDECERNTQSAKFNKKLQRWEGFVLDNGKCFKVWARSVSNPFTLSTKSQCEKELNGMKTALADLVGKGKVKRGNEEALLAGKFALELTFTALALEFPPVALFIPFLNYLWPSGSSDAWEKERAEVKKMINQKMNEAYANELKNYLTDLKKEMFNYRRLSDTSSEKLTKIVAIDTNLGLKERKFMTKKDPISTLTYYMTFVSTRLIIKFELIRVSKPENKQQHIREFLTLARRHTIFLGHLAYGGYSMWRRSKLKCYKTTHAGATWEYVDYGYNWKDEVTGEHKQKKVNEYVYTDQKMKSWCKQQDDPKVREMNAYIIKMRENIKAWASMFNIIATNPLVAGFSAVDSTITEDGRQCKLPFTYEKKPYTKCTSTGATRPWCYTKTKLNGKTWGYCFSVGSLFDSQITENGRSCMASFNYGGKTYTKCTKAGSTRPWCYTSAGKWGYCLSFDMALCQMSTKYNEQYFGHQNKGKDGKLCSPWTGRKPDKVFPMDGNSAKFASNYCRRTNLSDSMPWCYNKSSKGWSYCTIRACGSKDWD